MSEEKVIENAISWSERNERRARAKYEAALESWDSDRVDREAAVSQCVRSLAYIVKAQLVEGSVRSGALAALQHIAEHKSK